MLEAIQQFLPLIVITLGAPLVLWLTLLAKKALVRVGISETGFSLLSTLFYFS